MAEGDSKKGPDEQGDDDLAPKKAAALSPEEVEEVEEHTLLPAPFVYQVVRQEGVRDLGRPVASLWWSGLAAGILIGLSPFAEAVLHVRLPEADWRPLVEKFGYCVGFLVVVLARYQLFTENTITAILPLTAQRSLAALLAVARLWLVVAAANLVGAFVVAAFWTHTGVVEPEPLEAMRAVGRHTMENGWSAMLVKAIVAGFLMAAMVWMMPSASEARFWIIVLVTYVIAIGEFTHIVAGGVDILLLVLADELSFASFVLDFGVPVFLGNVIGGTCLFSLIAYAQVQQEVEGGNPLGRG